MILERRAQLVVNAPLSHEDFFYGSPTPEK